MVLKVNIGKRWWGQRVVALLLAGLIPFLVISDVFSQDGVDAGESLIDFSFDQVEISAFVKVVGGITGHRFVVSDDVKGRITVVAPRVKQSEAYGLFVSVLESAGCSVIKRGDIYHIVRLSDSSTTMAPVVGPGTRTTGEGL